VYLLPDFYDIIEKKFNGNIKKYADYMYRKSVFTDSSRFKRAINLKKNNLIDDPYMIFDHVLNKFYYTTLKTGVGQYSNQLDSLYQLYLALLPLIESDHTFYPDANFTLRLSYGNITGFMPSDAVTYNYYTTLEG